MIVLLQLLVAIETGSSFSDGLQSAKHYFTGLEAMDGVIIKFISAAAGDTTSRQGSIDWIKEIKEDKDSLILHRLFGICHVCLL